MKNKMKGVLGVALTLVLLVSLCAFAAPVAADPAEDDNEWETFAYPFPGWLGGYFYDDAITAVGPIDQAINGDLYAYAADATAPAVANDIFKSTDGGRTWTVSEHPLFSYAGGAIVDIVCSSENEDIVYVADATTVYCSMDGSETFVPVAPATLAAEFDLADTDDVGPTASLEITSLDVGYIGGDPYLFISTKDVIDAAETTANGGPETTFYEGDVFYVKHVPGFTLAWDCLELQATGAFPGYDAYAVNCPPNIETTSTIYAVITTSGGPTIIAINMGVVGGWIPWGAPLLDGSSPPVDFEIDGASNICFPGEFADDELLVGVSGATVAGSVYRVTDGLAPCTFRLQDPITPIPNADVISLELTGNVGATQLLAGAQDSNGVWYSNTDGMTWAAARKPPTGGGPTYVLMADDFADSGEAWAATSGNEAAVSRTVSGGDLWNQISLIGTAIDALYRNLSFYPDYETSGKMFLLTRDTTANTQSMLRYDGTYWERVAESTVLGSWISTVHVSPEILSDGTVYFSNLPEVHVPNVMIFCSEDEGQSWLPIGCQPAADNGWVVIDADTLIAGGNGVVYKNTTGGSRCWTEIDADINGYIWGFAVSGDTILCGSTAGDVAISEDLGDTWDMVGGSLTVGASDWAFVAFDTGYADNDTIYAACDENIYRCVIDRGLPWFAQEWMDIDGGVTTGAVISGIATADGCLYVSSDVASDGMWRSVNPTAPFPAPAVVAPLFEQVGVAFDKVADTPASFTGAKIWGLQSTSGSNVLWALDWANPEVLWTFEDTLVGPPDLESPADGTALGRMTSVVLTWEELSLGALDYDLMVAMDEAFSDAFMFFNDEIDSGQETHMLANLFAGTQYWWKVRVSPNDPLASKWSDAWSFATAMGEAEWNPFRGPVTEYPYPGASNIPVNPTFAWNKADWATGYEFVLSANADYTDPLVEVTVDSPVYAYEGTLAYSTTYYWKVRAVSATSTSNWAEGVFTTEAAPVEIVPPPAPVEIPPTPAPISPAWIWAVVIIGAVLVIAVIVLIVTTRRVP